MLKVLVVDDEMLARDELKYLLEKTKEVEIIGEADCVEDALEELMKNKPDIVFLDIQLSDDNGFEIANILKKMKNPPSIVFATAYDQYALQAFEVDALDYILKPFDEERIVQTLKKYKKQKQIKLETKQDVKSVDVTAEMHKLALPIEESIVLVNIEDIIYVGLVDGKVTVKTMKETYVTHDTLVILEKKLPQTIFMRVHRSFVANINHISEIQPWFNSTYNLIMKEDPKSRLAVHMQKNLKSCFVFKKQLFVFRLPIFVTNFVYLTFCYVNAYSFIFILYNKGTKSKEVAKMSTKKVYSFLSQAFIFSAIMLVSNIIATHLPIPMPSSVIGLVILFSLLCLKVIKLEQVESFGTALTGIIGFLFVPSGISVINSLGVMGQYFIQILTVIVVATIILLAVTGLFAQFILGKDDKEIEDTKELKVVNKGRKHGKVA